MDVLTVCAGCSRHVKFHETLCPFCGAALGERAMPMVDTDPGAPRGLRRGRALLAAAMTATASLSMAACYGSGPVGPREDGEDPNFVGSATHCVRAGDEAFCAILYPSAYPSNARLNLGRIGRMEGSDYLRATAAFQSSSEAREDGADFDGGVCGDPLSTTVDDGAARQVLASALSAHLAICNFPQPWRGMRLLAEQAGVEVCASQRVDLGTRAGLLVPSRAGACDPVTGAPRAAYEGFGVVTAIHLTSVAGPLVTPTPSPSTPPVPVMCPDQWGSAGTTIHIAEEGTAYAARRAGWALARMTPLSTVCAVLYPRAR